MRANELTTVQILTWRKISISLIEAGKGELKAQSCDMALFASIIREVYADPRIIRGTMARIAIRYCAYRVSGLHAVRVAARLRRELQADVEMVQGHYGEFKLLVDGNTIIDGGAAAFLGVLPSGGKIVAAVRNCLTKVNE